MQDSARSRSTQDAAGDFDIACDRLGDQADDINRMTPVAPAELALIEPGPVSLGVDAAARLAES